MKKYFIYGALAVAASLTSCDDMLDKEPLDEFINNPAYWSNSDNVKGQCNVLYNNYLGYGNGGGAGLFYFKSLSDDQASPTFDTWANVNVPSSSSNWSSPWTEIRRCNYIIQGVKGSTLNTAEKNNYEGVARLNRAWQYYQLVRMYGDVQWINRPLDPKDAEVYGARIDRDIVMDSVLQDLNFATATITSTGKTVWSKDMAQAMKADVTLYEGTYCKYRTAADNGKAADAARAEKYLGECVTACSAIMGKGYELNPSYQANYNSISLASNKEMIFYKAYTKDLFMHSTIDYTSSSSEQRGMTKDAFDSYLFRDGKTAANTSYKTSDAGTLNSKGNLSIKAQLDCRDKRLSQTIDSIVCFKDHSWIRGTGAPMTSSTGYNICKYDNLDIDVYYRQNTGKNYTDAPIYWLSVIYLDYAEAKAELGTITNTDLDNSINKLYARAFDANVKLTTTPEVDPSNNMGVSPLIWEIRRCRRCELMFDNWSRYWDLIRWHQLNLLDSSKNPNILLGANLKNATNVTVGVKNDYKDASSGKVRTFENRQYLYPVPSGQLVLNKNLVQNPLWK